MVAKTLNSNHPMHYLFANFVRILEVCKQYSEDLLSDKDNMPRCGVISKFSDLEVIATARGKKQYDKRQSIKEREDKRTIDRMFKH